MRIVMLASVALLCSAATQVPDRLPDRTLTCVVGRATNIDPAKRQSRAEIVYEGRHTLVLRLPSIAAHTGNVPDPGDAPEPVDARTRIVADPDAILRGSASGFERVVDLWPDRVEMIAARTDGYKQLMILSDVDRQGGRASLYTARVADAASIDLKSIHQGDCSVRIAEGQA